MLTNNSIKDMGPNKNSIYKNKTPPTNNLLQPKTPPKVIVSYKGSQYDITNFVKFHPGGKQVLLDNSGVDIEQLMAEVGHSKHAYDTLEKYRMNN